MGIELILMGIGIAVLAGTMALMMSMKGSGKQKLDHTMQISKCEEGQVIPEIFGRNIVAGNIVYWGNVQRKKIKAGGKGGMGGGGMDNFEVRVDVHYILGIGELNLNRLFLDEEEYTVKGTVEVKTGSISASHFVYKEHEEAIVVNACPYVTSVMLKNWYVGDNVTSLPNILFDVTRKYDEPNIFSTEYTAGYHGNTEYAYERGMNPIYILYYILENSGEKINAESFRLAFGAVYEHNVDEVCIAINDHKAAHDILNEICEKCGVWCSRWKDEWTAGYWDSSGNLADAVEIKGDHASGAIVERKTYSHSDVKDDYVAKYKDELGTERGLRFRMDYVAAIAEESKNVNYDLTHYREATQASNRLISIARRESASKLTVLCDLPLRYLNLGLGDWIYFDNLLGIEEKHYFMIKKVEKNLIEGMVKIEAEDSLWYDGLPVPFPIYDVAPSFYVPIVHSPVPANQVQVIPHFHYSEGLVDNQGFVSTVVIIEPGDNVTSSFELWGSADNEDYQFLESSSTFGEWGKLKEELGEKRFLDRVWVAFDDSNYSPETLTDLEYFTSTRVLYLGGEVASFKGVEVTGGKMYLTEVYRPDPIFQAEEADIIVAEVDQVFSIPEQLQYLKILPKIGSKRLGIEEAGSIFFSESYAVPNIYVVAHVVEIESSLKKYVYFVGKLGKKDGYGVVPPTATDYPTYFFTVEYKIDGGSWIRTHDSTIDLSASTGDIDIEARLVNGVIKGASSSLLVGTDEGYYFS